MEQIRPARSLAVLAQDAQREAGDDMALTLGHRLRRMHNSSSRAESGGAGATRRFAAAVFSILNESERARITGLANEFDGLSDVEVGARVAASELNAGVGALVLCMLAARAARQASRRKRLQDDADALMAQDGWQIELMGWLEFGSSDAAQLAALKTLYHAAQQPGKTLAGWFMQLRTLPERRRRLKALVRALGFDLSERGSAREGETLASVVTDLKRLLLFFGLEELCRPVSALLFRDGRGNDEVLAFLLALIDATWVYEVWLRDRLNLLGAREETLPRCAFLVRRIVQALPDPCFRDDEQRAQIFEALEPLIGEDLQVGPC